MSVEGWERDRCVGVNQGSMWKGGGVEQKWVWRDGTGTGVEG